jgi:hypothetical protein
MKSNGANKVPYPTSFDVEGFVNPFVTFTDGLSGG